MAVEMTPVQSSNLSALGYDPVTRELHAQFKTGGTYVYEGVSQDEMAALMASPSKGSHLAARIKGRYKHRKLGASSSP